MNASGPLPNDRTHVIKAFGYYALTPELTMGGNLLVSSGRPKQCLGAYPDASDAAAVYGSLFHYCPTAGSATNEPSFRGSTGRMPWTKTLDMNLSYKPVWMSGLELKVDVFNVFNSQTAARQRDISDPVNRYQMVTNYTAPRAAKLTALYGVKF